MSQNLQAFRCLFFIGRAYHRVHCMIAHDHKTFLIHMYMFMQIKKYLKGAKTPTKTKKQKQKTKTQKQKHKNKQTKKCALGLQIGITDWSNFNTSFFFLWGKA